MTNEEKIAHAITEYQRASVAKGYPFVVVAFSLCTLEGDTVTLRDTSGRELGTMKVAVPKA